MNGRLDLERMTPRTRDVVNERMRRPLVIQPSFFTFDEFQKLKDLAEVALPQNGDAIHVDLAGEIDTRLASGAPGKGWRYNDLPRETQMYREVLAALVDKDIETLLETQTPKWIKHFWEDFLAEVTETYYSHPLIQASIGAFGLMDERA